MSSVLYNMVYWAYEFSETDLSAGPIVGVETEDPVLTEKQTKGTVTSKYGTSVGPEERHGIWGVFMRVEVRVKKLESFY